MIKVGAVSDMPECCGVSTRPTRATSKARGCQCDLGAALESEQVIAEIMQCRIGMWYSARSPRAVVERGSRATGVPNTPQLPSDQVGESTEPRGLGEREWCGAAKCVRRAISVCMGGARGKVEASRAWLEAERALVEKMGSGARGGCSAKSPRASVVLGSRASGELDAPHPRGARHRAALRARQRAASGCARSCGVRSARVRADQMSENARGDEQDLRAVLEVERVLVENEGMGRRDGCSALSPRATGVLGPRACGTPNSPHVRKGRGRAPREVSEGRVDGL